MIYAEWIADVISADELSEIMARFEIDDEQGDELCRLVYTATREKTERGRELVLDLQERRAAFEAALAHFRMMGGSAFFARVDGSLSYRKQPPAPPGVETASPRGMIPAEMFEKMLTALIEHVDRPIALCLAEAADRKAIGRNGDTERHPFWFSLLVFWLHDLGRKLSVTNDPITGEPRGRLIDFMSAMSVHRLPPEKRTAKAIAGFIKRNKTRAAADPYFGRMRFMSV